MLFQQDACLPRSLVVHIPHAPEIQDGTSSRNRAVAAVDAEKVRLCHPTVRWRDGLEFVGLCWWIAPGCCG